MSDDIWKYIDSGMEAAAYLGCPEYVEGPGGSLPNSLKVAKRITHGKSPFEYQGLDLFCKQVVAKVIDLSCLALGKYENPHVPSPLGCFHGGYYYEYAEGTEGYPDDIIGDDYRHEPVIVSEFKPFAEIFTTYGLDVLQDICDNDGGGSKNIVALPWDINELYATATMHAYWQRIDFGERSMQFLPEKTMARLIERKQDFDSLGNFYDLAVLCTRFHIDRMKFSETDQTLFEELALEFRKEMLGYDA